MKHIYSRKNQALISELVRTDFKLRYQGSILGYTWSLLRPLMLFLILYVVFVKFLRFGGNIPHYPVYLLLGIVLWTFFSEVTSQSLGSIVSRGELIRKIRIPRWVIVFSSSLSALINLGLNLLVVLLFMVVNGVDFMKTGIFFPLILLEIYLFSLGASLFLAAAFVKYRDVNYIWEVMLQLLFYLTPILYPLTLITNTGFQKILLLNPLAQAIQDARNVLITKDTLTIAEVYGTSTIRAVIFLLVLLVLIGGVWYFKKESKYFAENI